MRVFTSIRASRNFQASVSERMCKRGTRNSSALPVWHATSFARCDGKKTASLEIWKFITEKLYRQQSIQEEAHDTEEPGDPLRGAQMRP